MADAPLKPRLERVPAPIAPEALREVEVASTQEMGREIESADNEEGRKQPVESAAVSAAPISTPVAVKKTAPPKDRLTLEIEAVMEDDLTDLFLTLPPEKRAAFKKKGEETATVIRRILNKARFNAKLIFTALKNWLRLIPGVNQFFLEQEAKIKTDKILLIAEEERRAVNTHL